jgi:hypothetical protein
MLKPTDVLLIKAVFPGNVNNVSTPTQPEPIVVMQLLFEVVLQFPELANKSPLRDHVLGSLSD